MHIDIVMAPSKKGDFGLSLNESILEGRFFGGWALGGRKGERSLYSNECVLLVTLIVS